MKLTDEQKRAIAAKLDEMELIPSADSITAYAVNEQGFDAEAGALFAANMRYTLQKVQEVRYPEYSAVNGEVLPVMTTDPDSDTYEYYTIDGVGQAAWIGDDGGSVTANTVKIDRHEGRQANMGHHYVLSFFDVQKYGAQGRLAPVVIPVLQAKEKVARRAIEAKTNWVWLFGDSGKNMLGLCTNPHIQVTLAPTKTASGLRVWDDDATDDEIAADIDAAINAIPEETVEAYHAREIKIPHRLYRLLRSRKIGTDSGFASLLDLLVDRYKGDESGQGRVKFSVMLECDGNRRLNPETGTDTSGITGDFLLVLPDAPQDELAFVRGREITSMPPEKILLEEHHILHSNVGGCLNQVPRAVHRFDFGA